MNSNPLHNMNDLPINIQAAEKLYKNHLKNVSNYQKRNPEKMRQKNKNYFKKLKEEYPEKYQLMLEKKKLYYINVVKPKKNNSSNT